MKLWYDSPANFWEEALPLGNGRLGAMVWSGVQQEKLSLNEDSLWSGYPSDHNIKGAAKHYQAARQMAMEGKYLEAQAYIEEHLLSHFTQSFLPLGELVLDMHHPEGEPSNYTRWLSLDDALSQMRYQSGGTAFVREAFVSAPDQAIVMRISADTPGAVTFQAGFTCQLKSSVSAQGNRLVLEGIAPSQADPSYVQSENPIVYEELPEKKGMQFMAVASFQAEGGTLSLENDKIQVTGANSVMIRICAHTSFNGPFRHPFTDGKEYAGLCIRDLELAEQRSFEELADRHKGDYQQYFQRVSISLGEDRDDLPIPQRLANWDKDEDMGRYALLFQYGRYLLISASRPGTQPANLQGIWNRHLRAPWSSNFTVNINTEMNYWPAEAVGLPEMHEPLFDLIQTLRVTGAKTAKEQYGARGFVAHHNTDIWGLSNPVGDHGKGTAAYAFWPMSAGWLSAHTFEHYLFTRDQAFLKDTAYPAIKDAARFYLDILVEDTDGSLIFAPSTSPENVFLYEDGISAVAKTTTMTTAIVREALGNAVTCCDLLKIDPDFREEAAAALARLPEYKIGSRGELLEWSEELPEREPTHRHTSHLYPLHPGHEITVDGTPDLAAACGKTLALRGGEGTGWALAWRINLWARLRNGEKAYEMLQKQLRPIQAAASDEEANYMNGGGCYLNLFGAHPPFQIDSNYGVCAGIAELLLQSTGEKIYLLPALPRAFQKGAVTGLRARGGVEVDISFRNGVLDSAALRLIPAHQQEHRVTVCYGGKTCNVVLSPAQEKTILTSADFKEL